MRATITNYRGITQAELNISKICLIAGPNESGKTSISQALAAALTGDAVPIMGVKKTEAGMLVRSGTANGSIDLVSAAGSTSVTWPSAKVKTEGSPPFASHFATGLQSIVNMDDKTRVKTLTEYLKATPTRADLDAQLASMGLAVTVIDQLWQLIETQGWDGAAAQIKEKGARLKGQWQQAIGEQYGSKKADSWIPEGYDNELMGQSESTLSALVTDARDALESSIAADAVDDSKRAEHEALAALLPERQADVEDAKARKVDPALQNQINEANGFIKEISDKRDLLNKELAALPKAEKIDNLVCPKCKAELELQKGHLVEIVGAIDDKTLAERKADIDALQSKITSVNESISKHMAAVSGIQSKIRDKEKANEQAVINALRLLGESSLAAEELKKPVTGGPSGISVDDCRRTLAAAELRLKAFQQKHEADRLHVSIGHNAELLAKIAPEGIRGDVLVRALKSFNDTLAPICKAASWRPVTLESDFMPCYGGTIYLLLSESAKFRVRTVLAMGMAALDGSQALIIDADILDKDGRNGLFRAVKLAGLPAMVCMTMDQRDLVPKLGALGASYWLENAVAEAV